MFYIYIYIETTCDLYFKETSINDQTAFGFVLNDEMNMNPIVFL